jgi:hypothetical protein
MARMSRTEIVEWTEEATRLVETRKTGYAPLTRKQLRFAKRLQRKMQSEHNNAADDDDCGASHYAA